MKTKNIFQEQKNLRKLNPLSRKNMNSVKIHPQNNLDHEYGKWLIGYTLSLNGYKFVSEAIFNNGKRADIYDYSRDIAFEIVCTEKEESLLIKSYSYPCEIKIIKSEDIIGLQPEELDDFLF